MDTVRCCPCPPPHPSSASILFRTNISNLKCMKMKLSCALVLSALMKPRTTNIPIVRRLRVIPLTTPTAQPRAESEETRTETPNEPSDMQRLTTPTRFAYTYFISAILPSGRFPNVAHTTNLSIRGGSLRLLFLVCLDFLVSYCIGIVGIDCI